jgi:hypothetical protein
MRSQEGRILGARWIKFGRLKRLKQDRERYQGGDKNTAYIFTKANQRKRKKTISSLEEEDGRIFNTNS